LAIDSPINSLPQVRSGAVKAYAVAARNRLTSAEIIQVKVALGLARSVPDEFRELAEKGLHYAST